MTYLLYYSVRSNLCPKVTLNVCIDLFLKWMMFVAVGSQHVVVEDSDADQNRGH